MCPKEILKLTLALSLTACASQPSIKDLQAERVGITAGAEPKVGMIQDAAMLAEFNLFPDSVVKKLEQLQKEEKNPKEFAHRLQAALCEGRRAKYKPSFQVELVLPPATPGLPLDLAAKARRLSIESNRAFLKREFFYLASQSMSNSQNYGDLDYEKRQKNLRNSSRTVVLDNNKKFTGDDIERLVQQSVGENAVSPNFASYKRLILDNPTGEAHWTGSNYEDPGDIIVPVLKSSDRKKITEQFSKNPYTPASVGVVRVPLADPSYQPEFFVALVFPKNRVLLLPRQFDAIKANWKISNYGSYHYERPTVEIVEAVRPEGLFYVASESGWKVKGLEDFGSMYPVRDAYMNDLAFIRKLWTFTFPKDLILKLNNEDEEEFHQWEDWGYDPVSHSFSPQIAIQNQNQIFKKFLASQTEVKESAISDHVIAYQVSLDTDIWCAHGTPLGDLQSE